MRNKRVMNFLFDALVNDVDFVMVSVRMFAMTRTYFLDITTVAATYLANVLDCC